MTKTTGKNIKITIATPKAFSPLSKSALAAARTLVGPSFTSLRLSFAGNTEQLQEYCAHCACTRLLQQYHVILSEYTIMSSTSFIMSTPMCHCGIVIFFKNQSAHVCAHFAVRCAQFLVHQNGANFDPLCTVQCSGTNQTEVLSTSPGSVCLLCFIMLES